VHPTLSEIRHGTVFMREVILKRQQLSQVNTSDDLVQNMLPHEFLLHVMRGNPVKQKTVKISYDKNGMETGRSLEETDAYASYDQRIDIAVKCAQYFAPKLSTKQITIEPPKEQLSLSDMNTNELIAMMQAEIESSEENLNKYPDEISPRDSGFDTVCEIEKSMNGMSDVEAIVEMYKRKRNK
jgi:hypothetical protein